MANRVSRGRVAWVLAMLVAVLLNAGGGTFQPASLYAQPQRDVQRTVGIAFGDFDGDGDLDVATALHLAGYAKIVLFRERWNWEAVGEL